MLPELARAAGFTEEQWDNVIEMVAEISTRDFLSVSDLLAAALPGLIGPLTVRAFDQGRLLGHEESISQIEHQVAQLTASIEMLRVASTVGLHD